MPHPPQPRRVQLQPDEEEEQHDAELGDVEHILRAVDQAQDLRAGDRAGDQIAESRAEAEAAALAARATVRP
jgi:hypothetical protein